MNAHPSPYRKSTGLTRRTWPRGLVGMAAALALALGGNGLGTQTLAASVTGPYAPSTTMVEGAMEMQVLPPSGKAPTWNEISGVSSELNAAKAATAKYQDVANAVKDGYWTAPILLVAEQGYHYGNTQYIQEWRSGHFDYSHPPFLVYNKVNGKLVLSGLMYLVPASTTPQQMASIFPASMAGWHRHINLCIQGGEMSGKLLPYHTASSCTAHGGRFDAEGTGWMTHAWIWNGSNSTGLFDMDMAPSTPMRGMSGM